MSSFYKSRFGPAFDQPPQRGYAAHGQYGSTYQRQAFGPGVNEPWAYSNYGMGCCGNARYGRNPNTLGIQSTVGTNADEEIFVATEQVEGPRWLVHVDAPSAVKLEVIQGWPNGDFHQFDAAPHPTISGRWTYKTLGVHSGQPIDFAWVRHRAWYLDNEGMHSVEEPPQDVTANSTANRGGWPVGDGLRRKIRRNTTGSKTLKPAAFAAYVAPPQPSTEEQTDPDDEEEIIVYEDDEDDFYDDEDDFDWGDDESWLDSVPGGGKTVAGAVGVIGLAIAGRKLGWF
jgi:hypothetical protein